MACNPEEQKIDGHGGDFHRQAARNEAMRATFMPCPASGVAQPIITSSISFLSTAAHDPAHL